MSKLDELAHRALVIRRELRALEAQGRKLSFAAFFKQAMAIAGVSEKRIDRLERLLESRKGMDYVSIFVRRLSAQFREPQFPGPHPDPGKLVRCYGSETVEAQLGILKSNAGEAQALAVRVCHKRFGDGVFGTVESLKAHDQRASELRCKLVELCESMRRAVSGDDLHFDASRDSLLPDERARGMVRATLNRAPGVTIANPEWPLHLLDVLEREVPETAPRRRRPKLRRDATAASAAL